MTGSDHSSDIISGYLDLLRRSPAAPEIAAPVLSTDWPAHDVARPCALLFSPHPDDECLTGALPLRLKQEQGWQIINIAVTLGSGEERRPGRAAELAKACAVLGIDCLLPQEDGFLKINPDARRDDPGGWQKKAMRLAEIIAHYKPRAVFMPHAEDWNTTHIGAHMLAMDALAQLPTDFTCAVAQTEYWRPMIEPNLMIGIGANDAAKILSALACHVGEVARNPYDRRFPAYLIDNVRRGSEVVRGKGAPSAVMDFAMLYKIGIWKMGKFMPSALNRVVNMTDSVGALFP